MIDVLKNIFLHCKYSLGGKVRIGSNVKLNRSCIFEGLNSLEDNVEVGNIELGFASYVAKNSRLTYTKIGRFSCIGSDVITCLGKHPIKTFVSVHPMFYSTFGQSGTSLTNENLFEEHLFTDLSNRWVVEIGSDCWIGNRVMIMDGIRVGHGAVVAAGAVVTKDVEPYEIIGGIPAKNLGWRFTEEQRRKLLRSHWWDADFQEVQKKKILFTDVEEFIRNWPHVK
jgi:acetyltransferase-like isoleucine patch superfamily enzyme